MIGMGELTLSECQREAMRRAYETGYYEVPREASLERDAEDLQVSHQALSERLRRGHRNLVKIRLCESPTPTPIER